MVWYIQFFDDGFNRSIIKKKKNWIHRLFMIVMLYQNLII